MPQIGIGIGIPGGFRKPWSPVDLGVSLLSWVKGDDGDTSTAPGYYDSLTELGSIGGAYSYVSSRPHDAVQFSDLKHSPVFRGVMWFASTAASSNWTDWHNSTGVRYKAIRFNTYTPLSGNQVIFATCIISPVNTGIVAYINASGSVQVRVCNGSGAYALTIIDAAMLGAGNHTLELSKSGTSLEVFVDGVSIGSGTIASPAVGAPDYPGTYGADPGGGSRFVGTLYEALDTTTLSPSARTQLLSYLQSRWNSVPGCRLYLDADQGITLNGGNVSAWADQAVGNDVTQATASAQPLYVENDSDFNGHAGLQGASGDYLSLAAFLTGPLPQPLKRYAVVKMPAAYETTHFFSAAASAVNQRADLNVASSSVVAFANGAQISASPYVANTTSLVDALYSTTSSEIRVAQDGAPVLTGSGSLNDSSLVGTTVLSFFGGGNPFTGKFAFGLILDHAPTADGDAEIRNALQARYGITPA